VTLIDALTSVKFVIKYKFLSLLFHLFDGVTLI